MALVSSRIVADSTTTFANTTSAVSSERLRITARREGLELPKIEDDPIGISGLAISGGGIRSATIGLGVLESLATAPRPGIDQVPPDAVATSLLSRFDYLSTVSGGGYIGGFLCSLFIPGRLRERPSSEPPGRTDFRQAAKDAYETLSYIPPSRLRRTDTLESDSIGHCPTAWLRENGRYLTPTGAGDTLYAAATALRNWLSVHYVLGTLFLCAFAALALARNVLANCVQAYRLFEQHLLQQALEPASPALWWSPLWCFIPLFIVAWLAPCGVAFWMSVPARDGIDSDEPQVFDRGTLAAIVIIVLLGSPLWLPYAIAPAVWSVWAPRASVLYSAEGIAVVVLLGFALHVVLSLHSSSITGYRVKTTQIAAKGIGWLLALTVVAICDTGGQQLYVWLARGDSPLKSFTPAGVLAVILWLIRKQAKLTDGVPAPTSVLKKLPMDVISGAVGAVALLLVGCLWNCLVQYISWPGKLDIEPIGTPWQIMTQSSVLLIALLLAVISGRFTGFINLSTLQSIYGARLTRAYLGASNGRRFDPATSTQTSADAQRFRSVAEPLPEDQIELHTYYREGSLAPLHIINVTVNQTIDPAEQLVQRDRKGKPLAVLPDGFSIDGGYFPRSGGGGAPAAERLTVGQWIGTSGAAFTTGLGRATSIGTSLALGLANVRLGTWWYSGQGRNNARGLESMFESAFRAQTYLLYELTARFYGRRRSLQYLSDGGHFENTALYELLRRAREVRFLLVCDNGCDPTYRFDDLANLIRLARIDYRLNIEIDTVIAEHDRLKKVFGVPADFKLSDNAPVISDKCALLLNVFDCSQLSDSDPPIARIVVLKPRVIASASVDICGYRARCEDFPQQTTADQFFDEAQWESYRALGYRIATLVFGTSDRGGLGEELWNYLTRADGSAPRPARAVPAQ
jgi:hypothetical protein